MKSKVGLLRIVGSIDDDAYRTFSEELAVLEAAKIREVHLELNSGGGDAYEALAIATRIRLSKCLITVTVYGQCQSAAVLILASCFKRRMTKEAWVMVHEDSGKHSGNVVELERQAAHSRRMEDQWAQLLGEMTMADAETWTALHKKTTYLTARECMELGLADEVI